LSQILRNRQVVDGAFFCQEDKSLNFGAVVCSSHPKGVVERIRVTNPFKINAQVEHEGGPKAADDEGRGACDTGGLTCDVRRLSWDTPL
jgi:hypothetical protein